SLPKSSEPAGQEFTGQYNLSQEGDDALTMDGSLLGKLIGRIRTESLSMCGCFESYKDTVPPNIKFKFQLSPDNSKPKNITLVTKDADPALVQCLESELAEISMGKVDQKVTAGYRFKFRNSRAMNI